MTRLPFTVLTAALILGAAGCATTPDPLSGEFAAITPAEAARNDARGRTVRWGGTIAAIEPLPDRTCFQIVGRELSKRGRPLVEDESSGRFLACRKGFYDPEVFSEGRSVTIVGSVEGSEQRLIGEYSYAHPRVAADVVFLWPDDGAESASSSRFGAGLNYGRYY